MILVHSMELDGSAVLSVISPMASGLADVYSSSFRCRISHVTRFKSDCYHFINIANTSYSVLWLGFMGFSEYFTIVCPELIFFPFCSWSNLSIILWLLTVKSSIICMLDRLNRESYTFGFVHLKFHHHLPIVFLFGFPYRVTSFYVFRNKFSPWGCALFNISNTADSHSASSSSLTLFNFIVGRLPYCSKSLRPIVRSLTLFPSSATEDWRVLICSLHKLISVLRALISSFSDLFEDLWLQL